MARWWKCDLQVATPGARGFRGPDEDWQLQTLAQREAAADRYMQAAVAEGLEVLVLADHNSADWVDVMAAAGQRHGVTVFPGFEVTTATGADGAHLVLFMDPQVSGADLGHLLWTTCGFDRSDHPRFDPARPGEPAPSPRTAPQILDDLPADAMAIAPHVFSQNGLARDGTVVSSLRWKALHHDRLSAVDVGDGGRHLTGETYRSKFTQRRLDKYPCLRRLPFVATSDAYSLDELGSSYTWIRMEEPTLEGLRQAFLDHEARIACDWDPRFPPSSGTPNDVSHAWVEEVTLSGLTTAEGPLTVTFDPRLTVIIGGRGAGKSTVTAALRHLYSDISTLPDQTREETERFRDTVLADATISANHYLPHGGGTQTATWTPATGSLTPKSSGPVPTDFKVRVVGQKELFERSVSSAHDPHSTSRNLLSLVDGALAVVAAGPGTPAAFERDYDEARTAWVAATRRHQAEQLAVNERAQVRGRVDELTTQVDAFDNEANRARRARNDRLLAQARDLDQQLRGTDDAAAAIALTAEQRLGDAGGIVATSAEAEAEAEGLLRLREQVLAIRTELGSAVAAAVNRTRMQLQAVEEARRHTSWQAAVDAAAADSEAYLTELAALGLDPAAYGAVRRQLQEQTELLAELEERAQALPQLATVTATAWQMLLDLHQERRNHRQTLLIQVRKRSGLLRFELQPHADTTAWVRDIRELLNLRSDGFLEEVPALAAWLWADPATRAARTELWREALVTGDLTPVTQAADLRVAFARRLRELDPLLQARLAAEIAADVVRVDFLRDGGDATAERDWQPLTDGSPGQRSAAMLSFVLHHGTEPLVLDQPEDDLDTEWITQLVVRQLRESRWTRQVIVVTHNANIPVNADAERVVVLEGTSRGIAVRTDVDQSGVTRAHCGPLENSRVRTDIQNIMEGGVEAFVGRERRYNNELNTYRAALHQASASAP